MRRSPVTTRTTWAVSLPPLGRAINHGGPVVIRSDLGEQKILTKRIGRLPAPTTEEGSPPALTTRLGKQILQNIGLGKPPAIRRTANRGGPVIRLGAAGLNQSSPRKETTEHAHVFFRVQVQHPQRLAFRVRGCKRKAIFHVLVCLSCDPFV